MKKDFEVISAYFQNNKYKNSTNDVYFDNNNSVDQYISEPLAL